MKRSSQATERILLSKTLQGDMAAFGEIIEKYQHWIYVTALQITADPASSKDIAQETFISALQALKDLRSPDSFPAWLRKIAKNLALAWLKDQRRTAALEDGSLPPAPPAGAEMEKKTEQVRADAFRVGINRVLFSLSETLRLPLLLCYVNDLSTARAAQIMGIKEGTLRKRLHVGKKKLQRRIAEMAEKTLEIYRLPPGFARRCICGCRRMPYGRKGGDLHGPQKEVRMRMRGEQKGKAESGQTEGQVKSAKGEAG